MPWPAGLQMNKIFWTIKLDQTMPWSPNNDALSPPPQLDGAIEEACAGALPAAGPSPDLAIAFVSSHHHAEFESLVALLRQRLPSLKAVVGCSGYGVLAPPAPSSLEPTRAELLEAAMLRAAAGYEAADAAAAGPGDVVAPRLDEPWLEGAPQQKPPASADEGEGGADGPGAAPAAPRGAAAAAREVEGDRALSLSLATLPGVALSVFHTTPSSLPDADSPPDRWAAALRLAPTTAASSNAGGAAGATADKSNDLAFVLLIDPTFTNIKDFLAGLDYSFPGSSKIGGLVSSSQDNRRGMFAWAADWPPAPPAAVPPKPAAAAEISASQSSGVVGADASGPSLASPPLAGAILDPPVQQAAAAAAGPGGSAAMAAAAVEAAAGGSGTGAGGFFRAGAVGLAMRGPIEVASVVAQGCRPAGGTWRITKAQRNIVLEVRIYK